MPFAGARLPKTFQEAVDCMIAVLGRDERELIRTADEAEQGQFHFGSGTGIRETFHLRHENEELLKSCGSEEMHPQHAPMVIIEALWRRLQTRHRKSPTARSWEKSNRKINTRMRTRFICGSIPGV